VDVDLSRAIDAAVRLARDHFGASLDPTAIDALFRELLWGPRETWQCLEEGLITPTEGANLLMAHLESRLLRHDPQPVIDTYAIATPLRLALMSTFPQSGPRALSIELVALPTLDLPRLEVRDYDPELDNIIAILDDVCELLHESRIVDFSIRIGAAYIYASVHTELCIVLEQLPAALAAIAARRDFVIDLFEQGVETKLTFTPNAETYELSVSSYTRTDLSGGSIGTDELQRMLEIVQTRFLALLAGVAPTLADHPWVRAWVSS